MEEKCISRFITGGGWSYICSIKKENVQNYTLVISRKLSGPYLPAGVAQVPW